MLRNDSYQCNQDDFETDSGTKNDEKLNTENNGFSIVSNIKDIQIILSTKKDVNSIDIFNDRPIKNNLNSKTNMSISSNLTNNAIATYHDHPIESNMIRSDLSLVSNTYNDVPSSSDSHYTIAKTESNISRKEVADREIVSVKTRGKDALNTIIVPAKKRRISQIQQKWFFPKEIQTDLSLTDIDLLFQYYQQSVEERNELLLRISTLIIDVDFFKGNDKKALFYTGLPTWSLLNNFIGMIKDFLPIHFKCKLSGFQMVVLTLMKLRLNLSFTDLGYRFEIDETTASRYFHRCVYILFKLFNKTKLLHWPARQNLLQNIPSYFRSVFKEGITIIIDCFEIFTERSSLLRAAAQGFSQYKHHATLKFLIGITITGVIIFISPAFGGRASDKEIILQSKFLDNIQEDDVVLADKGFLIRQEVEEKDATLKIPSFVRNVTQLHPSDVEESRNIARIRIHVERVICQLREKFNICADIAQMSAISKQNYLFDRDLYDKIVFVCSCLVNICPTVVPNNFEM